MPPRASINFIATAFIGVAMKHEKRREKVFAQLYAQAQSAFDKQVVEAALKLQRSDDEDYETGKLQTRVSLDPEFYVYVLMDPTKEGPYTFTLPGGKECAFPYLPRYIGKGTGNRVLGHNKEARKNPYPVQGEHKLNWIRKLHRQGLEPIEKVISARSIEAVALVKELMLIDALGRAAAGGVLTNVARGGRGGAGGVVGHEVSMTTREKIRLAHLGRKLPEEQKRKIGEAHKGRARTESQSKAIIESNRRRKGVKHKNPRSQETRDKLSAALKGKTQPQSVRDAVSDSNRRRAGEKRPSPSPELIQKRWEARRRNAELRAQGLL